MANTNDLMNSLFQEPVAERFTPYIEYSHDADAINVHFRPDPDYSQRISDHVTLFRSLETNEVVGCRIKGISGIIADLPNWLNVEHDGRKLRLLFWSFRGGMDQEQAEEFQKIVEQAGDLELESCR